MIKLSSSLMNTNSADEMLGIGNQAYHYSNMSREKLCVRWATAVLQGVGSVTDSNLTARQNFENAWTSCFQKVLVSDIS